MNPYGLVDIFDRIEEKSDDRDYEINVYHEGTLELSGGKTAVIPVGSSQLRAKISTRLKEMTVVYVRVDPGQKNRMIGPLMFRAVVRFAKVHGFRLFASGVYSDDGKKLVSFLVARDRAITAPDGRLEVVLEGIGPSSGPINLDDDMPHIVQYGGELGDDDGKGESGGDKDINEELKFYCDSARHLVCVPYSVGNLHEMARQLGIGRHWFHRNASHPHYDIPKRRVDEITQRCNLVSSRVILEVVKEGLGSSKKPTAMLGNGYFDDPDVDDPLKDMTVRKQKVGIWKDQVTLGEIRAIVAEEIALFYRKHSR